MFIFEHLIGIFRHVLILAVDRLDYETLHLTWLPCLGRTAKAFQLPSMQIQLLCNLFALFMALPEKDSIIQSEKSFTYDRAL